MAIISVGWICAIHYPYWRRSKATTQYIELDNLGKDQEMGDGGTFRLLARARRLGDIRGLVWDFASIGLFVLGCIIMQIVGLY